MTESIERKITDTLKSHIEQAEVRIADLTGTGDHFEVVVISDSFEGLNTLKRHRLVMDALNELLKAEVHAVKIKTLTNGELNQ